MSWIDWDALGIDPTTDRSAIRRAYAARLKAMDVDADPQGFADLRDARDAALAHAANPVEAAPAFDPPVEEPPPPAPAIDPREQARNAAIEDHFHALEALLYPGHDAPPTPDERAAIAHHGQALLADPRLEQIDFATGAERWFAENLAASVPRSDPLLEPAAAAFGWIARRDDYALSADAQAVVERIGAMRFAALVADPAHRLHRAWRDLTRADDAGRDWRVHRGPVGEVLTTVRKRYPVAEEWMNPARVARWDKRLGGGPRTGLPIWLAIILVVTVLRIVVAQIDSPPAPERTPAPLATGDPERVARAMTGTDLAGVAAVNPDLAGEIRITATGMQATGDGNGDTAQKLLETVLYQRTLSGLANAPDALLRDIATFEAATMARFAGSDPARCRAFAFPVDDARLPPDLRAQQRALLHRVVLASETARVADTALTYRVSGAMIADVMRRTGLDRAQVDAALSGRGEDGVVCRVQIALLRTALAAGAPGTALLRDMQPSKGRI